MSKDISPSVKIAEVGRARRASAVFFSLKASCLVMQAIRVCKSLVCKCQMMSSASYIDRCLQTSNDV